MSQLRRGPRRKHHTVILKPDVWERWTQIGLFEGFHSDSCVAKFLLSLYSTAGGQNGKVSDRRCVGCHTILPLLCAKCQFPSSSCQSQQKRSSPTEAAKLLHVSSEQENRSAQEIPYIETTSLSSLHAAHTVEDRPTARDEQNKQAAQFIKGSHAAASQASSSFLQGLPSLSSNTPSANTTMGIAQTSSQPFITSSHQIKPSSPKKMSYEDVFDSFNSSNLKTTMFLSSEQPDQSSDSDVTVQRLNSFDDAVNCSHTFIEENGASVQQKVADVEEPKDLSTKRQPHEDNLGIIKNEARHKMSMSESGISEWVSDHSQKAVNENLYDETLCTKISEETEREVHDSDKILMTGKPIVTHKDRKCTGVNAHSCHPERNLEKTNTGTKTCTIDRKIPTRTRQIKVKGITKNMETGYPSLQRTKISEENTDKMHTDSPSLHNTATKINAEHAETVHITYEPKAVLGHGKKIGKYYYYSEYMCSCCEKVFPGKTEFNKHITEMKRQEERKSRRKYKRKHKACPECQEMVQLGRQFTLHIKKHTALKMTCPECQKEFIHKREFARHVKGHRGERPFLCTICGDGFKHAGQLSNHMITHRTVRAFMCSICGKAFKSAGILRGHEATHSGEKKFQCQQCGRSFARKHTLNVHMLVHAPVKPYSCDYCNASFINGTKLRYHMTVHTNPTAYKCEECGATFRSPTSLRNHHNIHSGEKPCVCPVCHKTFSRPSYLRNHLKSHSEEKPYKCKHCVRAFKKRYSLNHHLKTVHPNTRIPREKTVSQIMVLDGVPLSQPLDEQQLSPQVLKEGEKRLHQ